MRLFKRGKSWYADYFINGKRKRKSFGKQKQVAELYLKNIEVKIAKGEELSPEYEFISVSDMIAKHLQYCKNNKAASTNVTDSGRIRIFQHFLEDKGIKKLENITPVIFEQFKSEILHNYSATTCNHYLTLIKAMLNKAMEWRHLKLNPLQSVKKLRATGIRQVRFFTKEELAVILEKSDAFMRKVIRILLYTGMRRSELVFLAWDDIDFHNKLITIQSKPEAGFHPKNYRVRSIPINPELFQLLLDLPQTGKYIFDDGQEKPLHSKYYYSREFRKILKAANIDNANLHTLRHTFASYLVMAGVDLRTVQELLGHSTVQITERYSHLSPDHKTRAITVLRFGEHGTDVAQSKFLPR